MKTTMWWLIRLGGWTGHRVRKSDALLAWEAEEQRRRRTKPANNDSPACDPMTVRTVEQFWGHPGPL